jgi:hypothetical protein
MQLAYLLSGGTPVIKRYKTSATIAAGVPVIRSAANAGGALTTSTTTSVANCIGVTLDKGAERGIAASAGTDLPYSTTQGDVEAVYAVLINPDAVWRLLMNGGATDGTALAVKTVSTASAGGTAIITGFDYSSPTMDEGMSWCTSGANVGLSRKITSVSTTTATVTVPYSNAISVGDIFAHAPYLHGSTVTLQFTTNLLNADATVAVGTGATIVPVDMELNGASDSYVQAQIADHVFAGAIT